MTRFQDKVAIVTGGSLGIGVAAARGFATEGGRVAIASRDWRAGTAAAEMITNEGGVAIHVATDVADEGQVESLCARRSRASAASTSSSTMPRSMSRAMLPRPPLRIGIGSSPSI